MANEKLENSNTGSGAIPDMAGSYSLWRRFPNQFYIRKTIPWSFKFPSE
jgi:hypothetical protein